MLSNNFQPPSIVAVNGKWVNLPDAVTSLMMEEEDL